MQVIDPCDELNFFWLGDAQICIAQILSTTIHNLN